MVERHEATGALTRSSQHPARVCKPARAAAACGDGVHCAHAARVTWTISIKMRYMKKSIAERPWRRAVES